MAPHFHVLMVCGKRRYVERALWDQLRGPKPEGPYACDGCSYSPDVWRGRMVWPACVIHDYHYREGVLGTGAAARARADAVFRENLARLLEAQGLGAWRAALVARLYWGRVRVWGAGAYQHWGPGEEPRTWWSRVREAWTR